MAATWLTPSPASIRARICPSLHSASTQPGTRTFARFTRNNVGHPFAIVVEGSVVTAPTILEPILGGEGQISGKFTSDSAAQLAGRIRSGTCAEVSGSSGTWLAGTG